MDTEEIIIRIAPVTVMCIVTAIELVAHIKQKRQRKRALEEVQESAAKSLSSEPWPAGFVPIAATLAFQTSQFATRQRAARTMSRAGKVLTPRPR
jgi:hypothetical protein